VVARVAGLGRQVREVERLGEAQVDQVTGSAKMADLVDSAHIVDASHGEREVMARAERWIPSCSTRL
jgi:hypothetical protein